MYRTTQKVVVWLGPAEDTDAQRRAFDLCRRFSRVRVKKPGLNSTRILHPRDVVAEDKDGPVPVNNDGQGYARGIDDAIRCYTPTTVDIIKASRSLDILQLCWFPPPPVISPSWLKKLPSWAPNLSVDTTNLEGDLVDPTELEFYLLHVRLDLAREAPGASSPRGANSFTAAKDSRADKVVLLDPASVLLRGHAWDTITRTAGAITDDREDARAADKLRLDFLHRGEMDTREPPLLGPRERAGRRRGPALGAGRRLLCARHHVGRAVG